MGNKKEKVVAYTLLILLILSLLPVMYLGRYNHPTGDDYYYGIQTKQVWEETGNIFATMAEAARGVKHQYNIWQGTYSAMFLMYLPPNIFGDWAYHLITTVILSLLTGGIFYLLKQILCTVLKTSKEIWIMTSAVISLLSIQTVPAQGETFFWYNGSMYYTGYYAVTLFMFGLLIKYLVRPRVYYIPILALTAVFLAGGNYVSLLPAILAGACITAVLMWKKSTKAWVTGGVTVLMILGLLVSAAAPGNLMRQEMMWKISAPLAVLKSLRQGLGYTHAWMRIWWFFGAIVLTPFWWKALEKIKFRFGYPVIVIGLIYGIFCSMSCPTFYTMNSTGPARAFSLSYYAFMLFTFACYFYLLGYLHRWYQEKGCVIPEKTGRIARIGAAVVLAALVCAQLFLGETKLTTTGKAIDLLVSGKARMYEEEYQKRLEILNDPSVTDAVLQPYTDPADMLFVGDISNDPEYVTNQNMAEYFGKRSVRVSE